jgi:hypothetical protein
MDSPDGFVPEQVTVLALAATHCANAGPLGMKKYKAGDASNV